MSQPAAPDAAVRGALAGAYGAAVGSGRVGTEHLLVAVTGPDGGPAGRVLDEFDVTPVVAFTVVRAAGWQHTDDTGPLGDLEWYSRKKPMRYTTAARAALRRAIDVAAADGRDTFDTGARALADLGVSHRVAQQAARDRAAPDGRAAGWYLRRHNDTAALVLAIVEGPRRPRGCSIPSTSRPNTCAAGSATGAERGMVPL